MKHLIFASLLLMTSCMPANDNRVIIGTNPRTPVATTSCPAGYVLLPAVSGFTIKSICVGKYEAQIIAGKAVSSASAVPSTVRFRSAAQTACKANGAKYDLINNTQWQALARNIEATSKNWSESSGRGALSLGHSDGDPGEAIKPGSDSNGCFGISDEDCVASDWHYQKRTMVLSNGQIIWDVAGNLAEWVSDIPSVNVSSLEAGAVEVMSVTNADLKKNYGSGLSTFANVESSLSGGLGYVRADPIYDNYSVGVIRGGSFLSMVESGIFAAIINVPAETTDFDFEEMHIGFRCVYTP